MGLCERCKKATATFHITKIDPGGEKYERHLCERCSVEEGHIHVHKAPQVPETLEGFISMKVSVQQLGNLVCNECGLSYLEFRNQGPLGCPNDYDAFQDALAPLLERAHDGGTHHIGKAPRSAGAQRVAGHELLQLRKQLEEAVAAEDYERAAGLRDRIRKLEAE